jgi:hypothetical protein
VDTSAIDLNLPVALDALLAERNVTRAAARLRLSQPALSARLARLRAAFGDPLLVPAARGMTLTTKALELEAPLRAALAQVRGVVTAARGFDPRKDALTLHIAASDYTQTAVLLDFTLRSASARRASASRSTPPRSSTSSPSSSTVSSISRWSSRSHAPAEPAVRSPAASGPSACMSRSRSMSCANANSCYSWRRWAARWATPRTRSPACSATPPAITDRSYLDSRRAPAERRAALRVLDGGRP